MRETLYHLYLVLTLRCEQAEELRLRRRYGETARLEDVAEVMHRAICGQCRRVIGQSETMDEAVHAFRDREMGG